MTPADPWTGGASRPTSVQALKHVRLGLGQPTYYTASGAIPPVADLAIIQKASAAAMTLAAPAAADDGQVLVITSETAAAHTVTTSHLLADGVSGSPHGTATSGGFKGATLTLVADNQLWNVQSAVGWTIT